MKKFVLLMALAIIALSSCTSKKNVFIEELTAAFNENNKELMNKVFPDVAALDLVTDGCTIEIDPAAVTEEGEDLIVPASVKRGEEVYKITITAQEGPEGYVEQSAKGILPLTKNYSFYELAEKTGAIDIDIDEMDAIKFLNDEENITKLQTILDGLKDKILEVQVVNAGSWENGEIGPDYRTIYYYDVVITNNSNYTFTDVDVDVEAVGCCRGNYYGTETRTAHFDEVKPGRNTGRTSWNGTMGCWYERYKYSSMSGVTPEDYQKAISQYNFSGNEFAMLGGTESVSQSNSSQTVYYVVVGSFTDMQSAINYNQNGPYDMTCGDVYKAVANGKTVYRICEGPFYSKSEAKKRLDEVYYTYVDNRDTTPWIWPSRGEAPLVARGE